MEDREIAVTSVSIGKKDKDLLEWKSTLPNGSIGFFIKEAIYQHIKGNDSYCFPPMFNPNKKMSPSSSTIRFDLNVMEDRVVWDFISGVNSYERSSVIKNILRKYINNSSDSVNINYPSSNIINTPIYVPSNNVPSSNINSISNIDQEQNIDERKESIPSLDIEKEVNKFIAIDNSDKETKIEVSKSNINENKNGKIVEEEIQEEITTEPKEDNTSKKTKIIKEEVIKKEEEEEDNDSISFEDLDLDFLTKDVTFNSSYKMDGIK